MSFLSSPVVLALQILLAAASIHLSPLHLLHGFLLCFVVTLVSRSLASHSFDRLLLALCPALSSLSASLPLSVSLGSLQPSIPSTLGGPLLSSAFLVRLSLSTPLSMPESGLHKALGLPVPPRYVPTWSSEPQDGTPIPCYPLPLMQLSVTQGVLGPDRAAQLHPYPLLHLCSSLQTKI